MLLGNLTQVTRLQEVSAPKSQERMLSRGCYSVEGKGHMTDRGGQKQLQALYLCKYVNVTNKYTL